MKVRFIKICLTFSLIFSFVFIESVFAIGKWNEGYDVESETVEPIKVTSSQNCKIVNNQNNSNDYFVPTKTQNEWHNLESNLPSNVSVMNGSWTPSRNSKCNGESLTQTNECGDVNNTSGTSCCSNYYSSCSANDVYWYNACNSRESIKQDCGNSGYTSSNFCWLNDVFRQYTTKGCSGASCTSSMTNNKQTECGASGYSGSNYCYSNDVYRNYITRSCSGGSCTASTSKNKQTECGTSGFVGGNYCYNNDVYRSYVTRGCSGTSCTHSITKIKQQDCTYDCSGGSCTIKNCGDGAILGPNGNCWLQSLSKIDPHHPDALSYCSNLNYAGHTNWTLPTKEELLTLGNTIGWGKTNFQNYGFVNYIHANFWASTKFGNNKAWRVHLDTGEATIYGTLTPTTHGVFCVSRSP